ncbi:MAG: MFS transporter [Burkholderiales bacterium]|nr:MFS transporter [Burkholderiales bacterium]
MLLALGLAATPFMHSALGLVVALGLFAAIGAGAGSFSVLIGAAAERLPPEARGRAAGVINAGGSFGQFVFAPLAQALIQAIGWIGALWALAAATLAALPLVRTVAGPRAAPRAAAGAAAGSPWRALADAFGDRSYVLLNLGFFTCGFHIAFLVTHLPQEVDLCGLPPRSPAGRSRSSDWPTSPAASGRARRPRSTAASTSLRRCTARRALLIAAYLAAPKTALAFYLFAAGLGFTWLATVPPTAAIVGKLFGTRFLATLFGMTLLSHQAGGFLGAWLGGLAFERAGGYLWMWYADMALAAAAALVNLPIREAAIARAPARA